MPAPTPARIGQLIILALAVVIIAFTFSPPGDAPAHSRFVDSAKRQPMPDFSMPDLAGKQWRLSESRGQPVLLNFWATWCPPCREEIPGFIRLTKDNRDFRLIGVAMDEGGADIVRRFVKTSGINYTVLLPPASSPFFDAVETLPTTFLLDKQGRIAKKYGGAISEQTARRDLQALEAEP